MALQADIIRQYLIGLGFSIDSNSYNKFQTTLRQVSNFVQTSTAGIARQYGMMAVEVVGAIGSISLATVGLLDKVSKADMAYQLFATRMYMTKDAAKQLKIATDAMGRSIDEIAWNPELRSQFEELIALQQKMEPGREAGATHSELRSIRFEFTQLKVIATYAMENIALSVAKNLAGPLGKSKMTLKDMNDWLVKNMPIWTEKVGGFLSSVTLKGWEFLKFLKEVWDKLKEIDFAGIWNEITEAGKGFADSLKEIQKSFALVFDGGNTKRQFMEIKDVVKMLVETMLSGVHTIAAFGTGIAGTIAGLELMRQGRRKEALDVWSRTAERQDYHFGKIASYGLGDQYKNFLMGVPVAEGKGKASGKPSQYDVLFNKYGSETGVDPNFLKAVATFESSLNPSAKSPTGVVGLMQATEDIHKKYMDPGEIMDRSNPEQSIKVGARYLSDLIKQKGGMEAALKGYKGPEISDEKYIAKVMGFYQQYALAGVPTATAGVPKISIPSIPAMPKESDFSVGKWINEKHGELEETLNMFLKDKVKSIRSYWQDLAPSAGQVIGGNREINVTNNNSITIDGAGDPKAVARELEAYHLKQQREVTLMVYGMGAGAPPEGATK